jgi:tetratricopeptide (TPR) repeat protein
MNPQDLSDVRKQAEYDRLMSNARVSRMRGDYSQAAESVRQALQISPEDTDAREFAADILAARGQMEKAAEIYQDIYTNDPARASAEEKFAKITLQIAEGVRQQNLLQQMMDNPEKFRNEPKRNPLFAALASAAPGFGQIYNGQFIKGIVIFTVVAICWLLCYILRPDVSFYPVGQRAWMFVKNQSPLAVIFACFATALQVYAFVDAPVYANKMNEQEQHRLVKPE